MPTGPVPSPSLTPSSSPVLSPSPIPPPLFVLSTPRSLSSVVSTMLGQHPQMYGLPEMQFFMSDTIENFWVACLQASLPLGDGLVRVAAELFFGGQTEETVEQAEGWVRRRFPMTTGRMLEVLAEAVAPRILVEKSPSNAYNRIFLQRIGAMFPDGLYIHLVRHPRGQAESVLRAIEKIRDFGWGQCSG